MHLYGCQARDHFLPFDKTSLSQRLQKSSSFYDRLSLIFRLEFDYYVIFSFICEETSEFYSRACFVIFKLNLLPKLKKLRPQNGTGYYKIIKDVNVRAKGPLLARHVGVPQIVSMTPT